MLKNVNIGMRLRLGSGVLMGLLLVVGIFELFFTTKEEEKGTGLGLSILYEIIKNHQGEITGESFVCRGATFTVGLPLAEPETNRYSSPKTAAKGVVGLNTEMTFHDGMDNQFETF